MSEEQSTRRYYDDPCGIARALNLIGERWAILVVRELIHGPKRFAELGAGLDGVSPNVLTQRLRDLTARGLVRRRRLGPPVSAEVYELTSLGEGLEPVLMALAHWGSRATPPGSGELSDDAFILALRTTFSPGTSCPRGEYVLSMRDDTFTLEVADGGLTSRRGVGAMAIATITAAVPTLRKIVFGGQAATDAVASGAVAIDGDNDAGLAFLGSFERPTLITATTRSDLT
ncbi:MAG: helix-turn-helix domain-containing protein [Acidimicrobiia bacterium]